MKPLLIPLMAVFTSVAALPPAAAQTDSKPVRLVIPFTPGGAQDVFGRSLGDKLAKLRGTETAEGLYAILTDPAPSTASAA